MNLDLIFARDGLLPLEAHSYTVSGLPEGCDTFNSPEYSSKFDYREKGKIEVDPATCQKVWTESQARGDLQSQKANEMLAAVMADSHVFGFVAAGKNQAIVSFRGTHFLSEWLRDVELTLVDTLYKMYSFIESVDGKRGVFARKRGELHRDSSPRLPLGL